MEKQLDDDVVAVYKNDYMQESPAAWPLRTQ